MGPSDQALLGLAADYLEALCSSHPDRHVGGVGNLAATRLFAEVVSGLGFEVTTTGFPCVVWEPGESSLEVAGERVPMNTGPYSRGAEVSAPLSAAGTLDELKSLKGRGGIVLLHGELVREQLTPKHYPFYQWETHTSIIEAIEQAQPQAIIAATGRNAPLVGSLYPFPLIEDADFEIPSAFITDVAGADLLGHVGETVRVSIGSGIAESTAEQVVARKGDCTRRIVVSGHIDSRLGSPGAIDNATGPVVLLLLAHLLGDYGGRIGLELAPFNGEDDYAAPGEMAYLAENGPRLRDEVVLNINVDGVGWNGHPAEVSLYESPERVTETVRHKLEGRNLVIEGEPWPQSDHMIFVMRGIPAVALTTADAGALRDTIAHTAADSPDKVDLDVVVAVARYLADVVEALSASEE